MGQRHHTETSMQVVGAALRNALTPRGGVAFDGTTNGRVSIGMTGQIIASDPYSVVLVTTVPLTIAVEQLISVVGVAGAGYEDLFFSIKTDGTLNVNHRYSSTDHNLVVSGFLAAYAGKCVVITYTDSATARNIYVNGVLVLTATASVGALTNTTAYLNSPTGSNTYTGKLHSYTIYNLALTAADVQEIYELGGGVPERFKFGSQTQQIASVSRNSDFSAGVGNTDWQFVSSTGAVNAGALDYAGSADQQRVMLSPSFFVGGVWAGKGKRYRIVGTISNYAVTGGAVLQIRLGVTNPVIGTITGNGTFSIEFAPDDATGSQNIGLWQNGAGTVAATLDNVTILRIGAIVHLPLDDGLGFQLQDQSLNRLHGLMALVGVSHLLSFYGPARVRVNSNTNGNQQMGAQVLIPANAQILRIRAKARTGTPTVTLGTASGGSQLVASVALTTSWKDLTIALTGGQVGGSDISLWAGSNSTDIVDWDVTWEPQSA